MRTSSTRRWSATIKRRNPLGRMGKVWLRDILDFFGTMTPSGAAEERRRRDGGAAGGEESEMPLSSAERRDVDRWTACRHTYPR